MPKNIKGTCALTLEECDLKESHIYPKFIFDYLLQKGGKRFRCLGNPTKVLQDGVKRHLLGGNAEQEFSKREKWFAEKLFIPFCNGQMNNSKLIYHDELYYFCVSLLWRVLYWVKDSIRGERLISKCNQAFEEWRIFLNGGNLPPNVNRISLMPITPLLFDSMPQKTFTKQQWNEIKWYIHRDIDSALFDLVPYNSAFFCKIPFFFFWAEIERTETNLNYGLRILPNGGNIDFKHYHIGRGPILSYILIRIIMESGKIDDVSKMLSEEQHRKIIQHTLQNIHFPNSELEEFVRKKFFT